MTSRLILWLGLLPALLTALALPPATATEAGPLRPQASAPTEDPAGARVIVRYKAMSSILKLQPASSAARSGPQQAAVMAQRSGQILRDGHPLDARTQVLHGDQSISSAALAARLAADSNVEFAVPDLRRHILALPNDPLFAASASISPAAGQWYLQPPDSTLIAAINAIGAWNITTGSSTIVVADIDTGVRPDHPDLVNKLLPGYNFVSSNGNAVGWSAGASDPGDYTTANQCGANTPAQPSSWHGTQVMGLIGAQTNNGIGMASIGHDVKLLPVRALAACGGYDSDIIAAMLWAAGIALPTNDPNVPNPGGVPANPNPAKVINLSLGSSGSCAGTVYAQYFPQIIAAGVTIVAAAGNDEGLAVSLPANCPGVIAVAGMRHVGTKVGFSDIGPEVAISAPAGNCVNLTGACLYPMLTTTNPGSTTPVASSSVAAAQLYTDSLNTSLGTSFAAPLVSGTAALMLSVNPALTPVQIKSMLQSAARGFPAYSEGATSPVATCTAPTSLPQDECLCTTSTCGAGLLDAGAAVAAAAGRSSPPIAVVVPSSTAPTVGIPMFLSGTSSSRSVVGYQWAITAGGGLATFSSATNTGTAKLLPNGVGQVQVSLTVNDSTGATSTTMKILAVDVAPTAVISMSSTTPTVGVSFALSGIASTVASSRTIATYDWAITTGANLATISSATNASTATLRANAPGAVVVTLTVTDSAGATSTTTQALTAVAAPAPVISASPATPTVGTSVILNGSGSAAGAGRSIVGYQWAITGGASLASFSGSTNGSSATLVTSAAGTVVVSLMVTDSAGATGTSLQTITVAAAPVVVTPPSSGGGGALGWGWLLGLAAAVLALAWRPAGRSGFGAGRRG